MKESTLTEAARLVRERIQWAWAQKEYDDDMMHGQPFDRLFPVTRWFDEKQAFTDKEGFICTHGQEIYDAVILLESANKL
eukprot:COSAG05_NODE_452_length_9699_cov_33.848125_6_plen_80_part_00